MPTVGDKYPKPWRVRCVRSAVFDKATDLYVVDANGHTV